MKEGQVNRCKSVMVMVPLILLLIPLSSRMINRGENLSDVVVEAVEPPEETQTEQKELPPVSFSSHKVEQAPEQHDQFEVTGEEVSVSRINYGSDPRQVINWLNQEGAWTIYAPGGVIREKYDFSTSAWKRPGKDLPKGVFRDISVEASVFTDKTPIFLFIPKALWRMLLSGYQDTRKSTALNLNIEKDALVVQDFVSKKIWKVFRRL